MSRLALRATLLRRLRQFAWSPSSTFSTQAFAFGSEPLGGSLSRGDDPPCRWVVLPAVPRVKGLARAHGLKELTALKWVTQCCPEIHHSDLEKLFRMRQVRACPLLSVSSEGEQPKLKRIARRDILPEGSVLYLPKVALERMEVKQSEKEAAFQQEEGKLTMSRKVYQPTRDDVEWARELVLHMDDHIIAINKPPGLAVQGGSGVGRSLDDLLGPAFCFDYGESPKLVHRLDKETSGIMVLGRTQDSTAILHDMFRAKTANATSSSCKDSAAHERIRSIKRKYWALVIGTPAKKKGRLIASLKKVVLDGGRAEAIVVADDNNLEDALEAVTEYRVLGPSLHGCTWLELHPHTGRKHQLRVHCAQALGMPILGDYKYGRLVHEKWFSEIEDETVASSERQEESRSANATKNDPSTLASVKGSITSSRPYLHLHSRLVAIPKIRDLKIKKPLTARGHISKEKLSFVDSLRLLAPLPSHMKASWSLVPPTLKKDLHNQFIERVGLNNKCRI